MSDEKPDTKNSTGLLLDGVFASEAIDSSGEILDIEGLDTTLFDELKGLANYEHQGHEDKDKDDKPKSQGQEIVGKVIYSHKIFKASDCRSEREKLFWDQVKLPFLYGIVRLADGAGHEGAKALAARIRDDVANNEAVVVGFSIEGSTLKKDDKTNRLLSTLARRVALTMTPCNKTAIAGLLADPNAPEGFQKTPVDADLLAMVPSQNQKVQKRELENPLYTRLGGSQAVYGANTFKAMTAGNYNTAPGTLTNGAALQREHLQKDLMPGGKGDDRPDSDFDSESLKRGTQREMEEHGLDEARAKEIAKDHLTEHEDYYKDPETDRVMKAQFLAAYRDWDRVTKFETFLKARMPEVSPHYINYFSDIIDRHVFRTKKAEEVMVDLIKSGHKIAKPREVPPPPAKTSFREGILTTPHGVYQASPAGNLGRAKTSHLQTMRQWLLLNNAFLNGQLNQGVVQHAQEFLKLAPGGPVPKDPQNHLHQLERHLTGKAPATHSKMQIALDSALQTAGGDGQRLARHLSDAHGVNPRLSRYVAAMLGAGNITIPEARTLRHHYGLPAGDQHGPGAFKTHRALATFDKHYHGHEAVQHVLSDPTIGPYFKGKEDQALLPAFLLHASSMPGARGGEPELWDGANLKKSEGYDPDLPTETAKQHHRWVENYGPAEAYELYCRHLLPKLQTNDALRTEMTVRKFEELQLDVMVALKKVVVMPSNEVPFHVTVGGTQKQKEWEPPKVSWQGKKVIPGHGGWANGDVRILGIDSQHVHAVPADKTYDFTPADIQKLPRSEVQVHSFPKDTGASTKVDMKQHGVGDFNYHPHSQEMGYNFDLKQPDVEEKPQEAGFGTRYGFNFWSKTPAGQKVYVKGEPHGDQDWGSNFEDKDYVSEPRREGVYSNLARDFFGMGNLVPKVAVVKHPQTGEEHAIIQHLPGSEGGKRHLPQIMNGLNSGQLDKIYLMDAIMGNNDRHGGNILYGDNPTPENPSDVRLIDHGLALRQVGAGKYTFAPFEKIDDEHADYSKPADEQVNTFRAPPHPEAIKWLQSLDPKEFEKHLRRHELPDRMVQLFVNNLYHMQDISRNHPNTGRSNLVKWAGQKADAQSVGADYEPDYYE